MTTSRAPGTSTPPRAGHRLSLLVVALSGACASDPAPKPDEASPPPLEDRQGDELAVHDARKIASDAALDAVNASDASTLACINPLLERLQEMSTRADELARARAAAREARDPVATGQAADELRVLRVRADELALAASECAPGGADDDALGEAQPGVDDVPAGVIDPEVGDPGVVDEASEAASRGLPFANALNAAFIVSGDARIHVDAIATFEWVELPKGFQREATQKAWAETMRQHLQLARASLDGVARALDEVEPFLAASSLQGAPDLADAIAAFKAEHERFVAGAELLEPELTWSRVRADPQLTKRYHRLGNTMLVVIDDVIRSLQALSQKL